MTKEEIIEIANQVKLPHDYVTGEIMWLDKLEQFAKLVAEKEREECAVIAETPISGEQDDITMEAKYRVAKAIRSRKQE